jgi:hypothetical protein
MDAIRAHIPQQFLPLVNDLTQNKEYLRSFITDGIYLFDSGYCNRSDREFRAQGITPEAASRGRVWKGVRI